MDSGPENLDEIFDRGVHWIETLTLLLKVLDVKCQTWENTCTSKLLSKRFKTFSSPVYLPINPSSLHVGMAACRCQFTKMFFLWFLYKSKQVHLRSRFKWSLWLWMHRSVEDWRTRVNHTTDWPGTFRRFGHSVISPPFVISLHFVISPKCTPALLCTICAICTIYTICTICNTSLSILFKNLRQCTIRQEGQRTEITLVPKHSGTRVCIPPLCDLLLVVLPQINRQPRPDG